MGGYYVNYTGDHIGNCTGHYGVLAGQQFRTSGDHPEYISYPDRRGLFFDVMLHLGTLVAIFVVYRKDILRMIVETVNMCGDIIYNLKSYIQNQRSYSALRYRKIVKNNYRKFVVLVLVSTIPTGIIGYIGREWWKKRVRH